MPKLIAMLTDNDETVHDAVEVFDGCADLPCQLWGFKDVGLSRAEMVKLVARMKERGKTTFLEVVSLTERECLEGAQLAIRCELDYLMGTVYFPSVHRLLEGRKTRFFPFCGRVTGHPSVVEGTIAEVVADGEELESRRVHGIDLLAYRFRGDAVELARQLLRAVKIPVIVAGSIDSDQRLDVVKRIEPWAFTIGSAFFDRRFVPEGSFRDQLAYVLKYLEQ